MASVPVREAVGVFFDAASLRAAADELMVSGFGRAALSLMADNRRVERTLGHSYHKVSEVADRAGIPHIAYFAGDSHTEAKAAVTGGLAYVAAIVAAGFIAAAQGSVISALLAALAAGAAGALVGFAVARLIGQRHQNYLREQLEHGGLVLWVRTQDGRQEERACEILRRHGADNVHVHDLPEAEAARLGGVSRDLSYMRHLD